MRLLLDRPVHCSDGPFGELVDILVDPATGTVTHIAVERHHHHSQARLVPIALVGGEHDRGGGVALTCTFEQAGALEHVEQVDVLPLGEMPAEDDPSWEIGADGVLLAPPEHPSDTHDASVLAIYDRIPKGEIEIRRVSAVRTADDHRAGHAAGLVVDAAGTLTHLLLEHGHLLGRRTTPIPIAAVAALASDVITLALTKHAIDELPDSPQG